MPFMKQRGGLLEEQDFYMTSDFADFLVSGEASRKDGVFELKQGTIKRHFTYETFVIDVEKEYRQLAEGQEQHFFIQTDRRTMGIYDTVGDGYAVYWRLLCHEGFVQTYQSADGQQWTNAGGLMLEKGETIVYQGFTVKGDIPLRFTHYTVYHDPHLTLQNFPEGFRAELYDTEGSLKKAALFDGQMAAKLYLDYCRNGVIKIINAAGNMVYETKAADYTMGDVYTFTNYLLEILYAGEVIDYGPTHLDEKPIQRMILHNASAEEDYSNITLAVTCGSNDTVQVSLDGSAYSGQVTVERLTAGAEQPFYVRIEKEPHSEFEVRDFEITIL